MNNYEIAQALEEEKGIDQVAEGRVEEIKREQLSEGYKRKANLYC